MDGVTFSEIKDTLRPLDLVFFSGSEIISSVIKGLQYMHLLPSAEEIDVCRGEFSHVGMVVTSAVLDHPSVIPGEVYIWESVMSGLLCQDGQTNISGATFGVQLRDLGEVCKNYLSSPKSRIAIGRLGESFCSFRNDSEMKVKFTRIFDRINGTTYDANPISLLASLYSPLRRLRKYSEIILKTEEFLFCSELVAVVFSAMGILDDSINPKNVVPMDFLGCDTDGEILCVVGELVYIVT
jgi:hypothetical protein